MERCPCFGLLFFRVIADSHGAVARDELVQLTVNPRD
jgi:hypothetical protein